MRRSLLRLSVAVIMLLMVLAMAAPAFAAGWNTASGCRGDDLAFRATGDGLRLDRNGDGNICAHEGPELPDKAPEDKTPELRGYDNQI